MPQRISHHLARAGGRVNQLELNARLGHSAEGSGLPVGLGVLLPHDGVEAGIVLVTEGGR